MAERCIEHQNYYTLPNGVECFDVMRFFPAILATALRYMWRAAMGIMYNSGKTEEGLTNNQKTIEDLKKVVVCINKQIQYLESETVDK